MKIETFKKLKNGRYKLEFDNKEKMITYDEVILNHNLLSHKEVTDELLNELDIENSYYAIYSKVMHYISTKMRSKKEIIHYLEKYEVNREDTDKIIHDLTSIGFINDKIFVKCFISDKIYLNKNGRMKIKKELLDHDIDEKLIDDELLQYEDNVFLENLQKLMEKKIKNTKYSGYILKQKLLYEFGNLGYETELILDVFNNMHVPSHIEEDINKYYQSLCKKYEGNTLLQKLKSKLYSKGYSIDEINEAIEKRIG